MATSSTWKDRWVCIGGGTAGFGLVLAQQFARRGANVAIVGRDGSRAESAAEELRKNAIGEIVSFSVDLADENSVSSSSWKAWLAQTNLSVAIAAAGKSDRGFLMQLSIDEIDKLIRTNVYTSFNFSKATEDALRKDSGALVHLASLAGIVASPGMGGYSIAKHAVVAMSRQLRLELASQGIRVLLVCPGPIQREETTESGRYDALVQERALPGSLKKPAGGANLKALDPEQLAEKIIAAIESRKKELILPAKVRWLAGLGTIWPGLTDYFLKMNKTYPLNRDET